MFPLANVVYLFTDEFTCLCAGRLSFALVLMGSFQRLFFRHIDLLLAKRSIAAESKGIEVFL